MPSSTVGGHKLLVDDLPADVSHSELQTVFSTYGEIVNIQLIPPQLGKGKRAALVFYATQDSAEDAIDVLNGIYKIREDAEHPIKVGWVKGKIASAAQSDPARAEHKDSDGFKLFVGHLPTDCREQELLQVFRTYGEVNKVNMRPSAQSTRKSAFVHYSTSEAAYDAIQVLDAQYKIREDAEHPISVSWAIVKKKKERDGGEKVDDKVGEKGGEKAGEKSGEKSSEGCGGVKHESSADSEIDEAGESSKSKGDGGDKAGEDAEEVPQWGNRKGAGKSWNPQQEPTKVCSPDGWKIFVGGLPKDISEKELSSVFSTYGEVKKIHILLPKIESRRAAAFIFYFTDSAAVDAIEVLNGVYKIREDAELPIQVRWASERTKGKGEMSWTGVDGKGWSGDSWALSAWPKGGCKGGKFGKALSGWDAHSWEDGWLAEDAYGWGSGWSDDKSWSAEGWYEAPTWASSDAWEPWAPAWYDKGSVKGFPKGKKGGNSKGKGDMPHGGKSKGEWQDAWSGDQKGGKGKDWQGGLIGGEASETKLFVGNLPDDIAEEALQYVFGTYGKVENVHIMTGKSRTGQSCAFVEMAEASEADVAKLTLHDKYEIRQGYGPIVVRLANATNRRKE